MPDDSIPQLGGYDDASLDQAFASLTADLERSAASLDGADAVEHFRLEWLGRKQGRLKTVSDAWLKTAPTEARRALGQRFNGLKERIETLLTEAAAGKRHHAAGAAIDVTLPGTRPQLGAEHPILRTWHEAVRIFAALGYSVATGPEVETDYYNFESLNFPPNHPARDTQDTLVVVGQERKPLRDRLLMRTHTSPVQIRTMEQQPPPIRLVIPGKVHRNDAADATHSPIFHQVEGLCVDQGITFADLKGTLDYAMKAFFGSSVKTRFFPSFFPVHGAERGRADLLHLLRRQGLPQVQALRLDRAAGLRHGGPGGLRLRARKTARLRPGEDLRLRLRHGSGPHRDDEVRRHRHRPALLGRRAVSGAVRMNILSAWLRAYLPTLTASDRQLADDLTLRGIAVEGVFDVAPPVGGSLYETDITTNRVDAMNHYGIAREAAAIYGLTLPPLDTTLPAAQAGRGPRLSASRRPRPAVVSPREYCAESRSAPRRASSRSASPPSARS